MVNHKDLKVGDYVIAISDCCMVDDDEIFAVKGKKYEVIELVDNSTYENECFIIRDEVGSKHRFPYSYLDPKDKDYLYDIIRLTRIKKIKSLYD